MDEEFELDYDEDELAIDAPVEAAAVAAAPAPPSPQPTPSVQTEAAPTQEQLTALAVQLEPLPGSASVSAENGAPASSVEQQEPAPAEPNSQPTAAELAKAAHDPTKDANGQPMAPDWVSRLSGTTGDVYYRNVKTGESGWDIPAWPNQKPATDRSDFRREERRRVSDKGGAQATRQPLPPQDRTFTDKPAPARGVRAREEHANGGSDKARYTPVVDSRKIGQAEPQQQLPPPPTTQPKRKEPEPQGPAVWKLTGAAAAAAARRETGETAPRREPNSPRVGRHPRDRSPPRGGRNDFDRERDYRDGPRGERDDRGPPPRGGRAGGRDEVDHRQLELAVFKVEGQRGKYRTPANEPPSLEPIDNHPNKRQRSASPAVKSLAERLNEGTAGPPKRLERREEPRRQEPEPPLPSYRADDEPRGDLSKRLSIEVKGVAAPRRDEARDQPAPRPFGIKGAGSRPPPVAEEGRPEPIEPGKPWGRQPRRDNVEQLRAPPRVETPNPASLLSRLGGADRPPHQEPPAKRWAGDPEREGGRRGGQRQWGR